MERVGSRPGTRGRTSVSTSGAVNGAKNGASNGAASNGLRAKTNGATIHRPVTNGAATAQPAVKLAHVNNAFGKTAVLKEINLSVAPGELVEIVAPRGSGKTTLLRLVPCLLLPTDGDASVQGHALHRLSPP